MMEFSLHWEGLPKAFTRFLRSAILCSSSSACFSANSATTAAHLWAPSARSARLSARGELSLWQSILRSPALADAALGLSAVLTPWVA